MSLSLSIRHQVESFTLNADFEAPAGITMLYGRSGAGKTTIINALAGLMTPDVGRITLDDRTLFDTAAGINLPPHRRRVGYIFQDGRLFPHLTVRQNLLYGRWFAPRKAGTDDTDKIVEMLGLASLLERRPSRLSGGEKQRVAIGRALLSAPDILLADEPLAALDDARKEEILPYFESLRDDFDVPILYVSHAEAEVTRLATTLVVLEQGKVIRQGAAEELLSDPSFTPLGAGAAGVRLTARIDAQHADGITEVRAGSATLLLPRVPYAVGTEIRMRIAAQDVMIAKEKPTAISALNVLPARVSSMRQGTGPGVLVQLEAGGNRLLARITQRSAVSLNLQEGDAVFAVLKAVSVPRQAIGDRKRQRHS